jgi:hypothetical protein
MGRTRVTLVRTFRTVINLDIILNLATNSALASTDIVNFHVEPRSLSFCPTLAYIPKSKFFAFCIYQSLLGEGNLENASRQEESSRLIHFMIANIS